MTLLPTGISAIIFDLGGVLVDLSIAKTIHAFSTLSGLPEEDIKAMYLKHTDFFAYERGEMSDPEFRVMIRRLFSLQASDAEIDACWNAMLIGVPKDKLKLVDSLKSRFSIYVLSNTNNIHMQYVNTQFLNGQSLDANFHKCYYSHEVGMRKPEEQIYMHVLQDAKLVAGETLFLDDNLENVNAAIALGIQTMHISHPDLVFDIVKKL